MHPSSELQVVSVNVGLPRAVVWKGRTVVTGIFKEPVAGRVAIRRLNLEGDRQADLTVHGGAEKAVYASLVASERKLRMTARTPLKSAHGKLISRCLSLISVPCSMIYWSILI